VELRVDLARPMQDRVEETGVLISNPKGGEAVGGEGEANNHCSE